MEVKEKKIITVRATISAPVEKVWNSWTEPRHIMQWNNASEDWHTPYAENDLCEGGSFLSRMEARDGSVKFDFTGTYNKIEKHRLINYTIADGRKVRISFLPEGQETHVTETFEAESTHSAEMQQAGWQSILDHFKHYVEALDKMEKLEFEISIQAPVEVVYSRMLGENTYNAWSSEFNPDSHFKGSWEKGAKILFIGTDQDGQASGMVSRIRENIPNKFVSVEHIGLLQGDKEVVDGPEVAGWAGAQESYRFKQEHDHTLLSVEMDANTEFSSYFQEAWPKALNRLKVLCENKSSDQ